jgi:GntR family transcriptional regulator
MERDQQLVEDSLVRLLAERRGAVREALHALAMEGVVERRRGSGTRVACQIVHVPVDGEIIPIERRTPGAETPEERIVIHQLERRLVRPPEPIRKRLELVRDEVLVLDQLLSLDDVPVGVRTSYLSIDDAEERVLSAITGSTHHPQPNEPLFKAMYGEAMGRSDRTVESAACVGRTARVLGVAEGMPMLLIETLLRGVSGRPRILAHAHLRGDRIAIFASSEHESSSERTDGYQCRSSDWLTNDPK